MSDQIWFGGFLATVCLVILALRFERWWPVPYVLSCLLGFGTGVLIWSWPGWLVDAWWLLGLVYFVALPFWKVVERRRIIDAEKSEIAPHPLRDGAEITTDENFVYMRDPDGRVIDKVLLPEKRRC